MANYLDSYELQVKLLVNGSEVKKIEDELKGEHVLDFKVGQEYRNLIEQFNKGFSTTLTIDINPDSLAKLNSLKLNPFGASQASVAKTFESDEAYLERLYAQATKLSAFLDDKQNDNNERFLRYSLKEIAKPLDKQTAPGDSYADYFENSRKSIDKYTQALISLEAIEQRIVKLDEDYERRTYDGSTKAMRFLYGTQGEKLTLKPQVPERAEIQQEVKEVQQEVDKTISPTLSNFVVTPEAIASIKQQIEDGLQINLNKIAVDGQANSETTGSALASFEQIGNSIVEAIQTALSSASLSIDNASINVQNASTNIETPPTGGSGDNGAGGATKAEIDYSANIQRAEELLARVRNAEASMLKSSTDEAQSLVTEFQSMGESLQNSVLHLKEATSSEGVINGIAALDSEVESVNRRFTTLKAIIPEIKIGEQMEKAEQQIRESVLQSLRLINQVKTKADTASIAGSSTISGQYHQSIYQLSRITAEVEQNPSAENVAKLALELDKVRRELVDIDAAYADFKAQKRVSNMFDAEAQSAATARVQIERLNKTILQYGKTNSAMMKNSALRSRYEGIVSAAASLAPGDTLGLKKVQEDFANLQRNVSELGLTGKATGERIKGMFAKFGGWSLVTRSTMRLYMLVRRIFSAVRELDTAMVNLKKVSEGSAEDYANMLTRAADSAQRLGTSITSIVEATAQFSRLGYNLEESTKLGEYATLYSKVAEDLTATDAAQSIVSTMKAFRMEAEDAIKIVDLFNYVGRIIAQVCRNVYKQIAISVKSQRWSRPRKDLFVGIRNDCNTLRGNTSGFAILEDTV